MARDTEYPGKEDHNDDVPKGKRAKIEYGDPEGDDRDPGRAHHEFDRRLRVLEGGRSGEGDDDGFPWWAWLAVGFFAIAFLVPGVGGWLRSRISTEGTPFSG